MAVVLITYSTCTKSAQNVLKWKPVVKFLLDFFNFSTSKMIKKHNQLSSIPRETRKQNVNNTLLQKPDVGGISAVTFLWIIKSRKKSLKISIDITIQKAICRWKFLSTLPYQKQYVVGNFYRHKLTKTLNIVGNFHRRCTFQNSGCHKTFLSTLVKWVKWCPGN